MSNFVVIYKLHCLKSTKFRSGRVPIQVGEVEVTEVVVVAAEEEVHNPLTHLVE
jgi:hypothetical protein